MCVYVCVCGFFMRACTQCRRSPASCSVCASPSRRCLKLSMAVCVVALPDLICPRPHLALPLPPAVDALLVMADQSVRRRLCHRLLALVAHRAEGEAREKEKKRGRKRLAKAINQFFSFLARFFPPLSPFISRHCSLSHRMNGPSSQSLPHINGNLSKKGRE